MHLRNKDNWLPVKNQATKIREKQNVRGHLGLCIGDVEESKRKKEGKTLFILYQSGE